MPADRLIHPRLGHSEKVNLLTDLEYRVWNQYLLSADDFGVMRRSAVTLQADNDHLSNRPKKIIDRCLDRLVKLTLTHPFEHQGRAYVYQRDWQRWQKVEYPRATVNPAPDGTDLAACDEATRALFAKHPGGQRKDRRRAEDVPSDSGRTSQTRPEGVPPTRAGACETANANGTRLTANANGSAAASPPDARSKRLVFVGNRLRVFEWMLTDLQGMLGPFAGGFAFDTWFDDLDQKCLADNIIPPDRDNGVWLKAVTLAEAQRRGLPLRKAVIPGADEFATLIAKGPSKRS